MIGLKFKGRPAENLAQSVKDIARMKDEQALAVMDRRQAVDEEMIGSILAQGVMSYEGRNPRPALDADGNFIGTDLDLLSFLVPVAARGAVIEIPRYRNRRQAVRRTGERKIGTNQFGQLTGLTSNQEVFSFSVRIFDQTIVRKDQETGRESVGAWRNYMVVDCDGFWYDGWDRIVWDPSREENAFLTEKGLWTGNTVRFQNFVHPNRWQSVYGAPYLLKKMLVTRLDDEAGFYRSEMKRLLAAGITFPDAEKRSGSQTEEAGRTEKIQVRTMEMILTVPDFTGSYQPVPDTQDGLVSAYRRQKLLTYTWKPMLQFVIRANEAAFMRFGLEDDGPARIAYWMGERTWSPWQKSPRSSVYQRMVLSNDMALLYRTRMKTETVSAE